VRSESELRRKLDELEEKINKIATNGDGSKNTLKMLYEAAGRADGIEYALGERDEI
jgi:hypothetical protein